ncbi:signal peptide peptidase SppA [Candidatus Schneideria nysicola]|uniref:signal peptide peptidase SppA n=1 Tax=Candidatus Schneideria nysicola TaxID=1081631 RepID=UPI001CAA42B3|nr:signal peptide peptidase SppA [Candidatus Schneideria nysicola]UAJ65686.1 signal peptide peptidase SppA [Candidatus Schneideria nysicola]
MQSIIKKFFRFFIFFGYVIGFINKMILSLLTIGIILIITMTYLKNSNNQKIRQGALVIDIAGIIVDKSVHKKLSQLNQINFYQNNNLQENSLFKIIQILYQAKSDPLIQGLILSLKNFSGTDQATLHYIGKVLNDFKKTGKPIYAIGSQYSQNQYFLASYANKIYLNPQGMVDIRGMATNSLYYNTFFKNLKINTHIFRVGSYKSAVEPFLLDNMSDAVRKVNTHWIKQMWQHYLSIVAYNRNIDLEKFFPDTKDLLKKLHELNGDTAKFALENKWVDVIATDADIEEEMIKIFGFDKKNRSFNKIYLHEYEKRLFYHKGKKENKIAIIFVNGIIFNGQEISGYAGSDTIINQIRLARFNPEIKAIIIRVNSPGGSLHASEMIRSEIMTVRKFGKPIIISMGGLAASGGYWISMSANTIIASPVTLTGSIGIFGIIHTLENSLHAIGIHEDGVSTSTLANISVSKALPKEFADFMQLSVENGYNTFIKLVSQNRNKTIEDIEKLSQGRIWTGKDAFEQGLIDQLGDFDDAVKEAAKLANLKKYTLYWYIDKPTLLYKIVNQFSNYLNISNIIDDAKKDNNILNQIISVVSNKQIIWNDPRNRYALCVTCFQYYKIM